MKSLIIKVILLVIGISSYVCNGDVSTDENEQNTFSQNTIINSNSIDDSQNINYLNQNKDINENFYLEEKQEIQEEDDNEQEEQMKDFQRNSAAANNDEEVNIDINLHQEDYQAQDSQIYQKKENQQQVDIIALEIQQIQNLIELHKTKLLLLSNLRENMLKNNITFQEFNATLLKKKGQRNVHIPNNTEGEDVDNLSAKINSIYQSNTKKMSIKPTKVLEFQQNTFLNRLNRKFTVDSLHKINSIRYINTFSYKTNKDIKANQMVASLTNDQNIIIHDFSGDMAIDPYSPGHQIQIMTVSQMTEDVFVATIGDDFMIRIAKIENQKVKSQFSSEENQFKYKMKTDQSIKLISLNKDQPILEQVRTFEYVQFKGHMKLFLIGDQEGYLHIYNKNGTFIGKEELSTQRLPILSLQKVTPLILFQTEKEIGFFSLNTLKKSQFTCPVEETSIQKIRIDPYSNNMFFALTQNQQLIVYDFKNMEEYCKIREVFDFETQLQVDEDDQFNINKQHPHYNTFIPIKNFILLMSNSSNKVRILNTTEILTEGIQDGFDITLFDKLNMSEESMQFIYQQKIYQGNYLIIGHSTNQGLSTSYSLYEILIPASKDVDYFSQIRLPLIVTAIVGIISYQIWKNFKQKRIYNKKGGKTDKYGLKNNSGMDQFAQNPLKAPKLNEKEQINSYKDRINQLEETTQQLLKNTSKLEQKQKSSKKMSNYNDFEKDEDDEGNDDNFNYFQQNNSTQRNQEKGNNLLSNNDKYDYRRNLEREIDTND